MREPVLVRISAAKRLRDAAEAAAAKLAGETSVSVERLPRPRTRDNRHEPA